MYNRFTHPIVLSSVEGLADRMFIMLKTHKSIFVIM